MAKPFFKLGLKAGGISALFSALMLINGCNTDNDATNDNNVNPTTINPIVNGLPTVVEETPVVGVVGWDVIETMVRTDPANPQNERFLDDWRFQAYNIDDQGRQLGQVFYGETDPSGNAALGLPTYMFNLPLVISAYNDAYPLTDTDDDGDLECRSMEIFVPANCYDKSIWLVGPVEDAVWRYYKHAAGRRAEAWNPSQVDCAGWLAKLQLLIGTDKIDDALEDLSNNELMLFDDSYLIKAFQENQQVLVPTRPAICMASRFHEGGKLERAELLDGESFPYTLDDSTISGLIGTDVDPVVIGSNGIVDSICGIPFNGELRVNGAAFAPTKAYELDDEDFLGTVHDQVGPPVDMSVSTYNVRMTNGRQLEADKYDDACSLTGLVQFTNTDDDEQDVLTGTGITFTDLFDNAVIDTGVYLTSDGDAVVDNNDTWAIFYDTGSIAGQEKVIAVTLLGHRQEDYRDVLQMELDGEDLFLGLRADFELNEESFDGETAYLSYTITTWDASSAAGRQAIRNNIANCYEASDVWARQYFITKNFQDRLDEHCPESGCEIDTLIGPFEAAEYAVRSECFSNSRANQRWQTDNVGYYSMNTTHGVEANIVVNPGWLAPNLDFEIYINRFDEAVFKGPRTIARSDDSGQLIIALPTVVEGDRVLIRSEDSHSIDYNLVLPCVPEFTGFVGAPGLPYIPLELGPPVPVTAIVDEVLPGANVGKPVDFTKVNAANTPVAPVVDVKKEENKTNK